MHQFERKNKILHTAMVELRIIMLSKIKNNHAQNVYVNIFFEIHSCKIKDTFFSQNHI